MSTLIDAIEYMHVLLTIHAGSLWVAHLSQKVHQCTDPCCASYTDKYTHTGLDCVAVAVLLTALVSSNPPANADY